MALNERRIYKLQGIGGSIYVALPKEWIRRFGLDKGSSVEISMEPDGSLRIRPVEHGLKPSSGRVLRASVEVADPDTVPFTLVSLYLAGFDVVELKFPENASAKVRDPIEEARRLLLGLEVVEEASDYIVLHVFSTDEAPVEVLIRNMGRLARTMYFDVVRGLRSRDLGVLRGVEIKENDLDRLYFFTVRSIRKTASAPSLTLVPETIAKLIDLRIAAKIIEEIGDQADRAAKEAIRIIESEAETDFVDSLSTCLTRIDDAFRNSLEILSGGGLEDSKCVEKCLHSALEGSKCVLNLKREYEGRPDNALTVNLLTFYENMAANVYDLVSLVPIGVAKR